MREILFRGKRIAGHRDSTKDGTMLYGSLFVDKKGQPKIKWYNERYSTSITSNVDPKTVGQFTGLLDKNGNRIYEGDIVRRNSVHMLVGWHEASAMFEVEYIMDGERYCNTLFGNGMLEVIGNIHDNPELIS